MKQICTAWRTESQNLLLNAPHMSLTVRGWLVAARIQHRVRKGGLGPESCSRKELHEASLAQVCLRAGWQRAAIKATGGAGIRTFDFFGSDKRLAQLTAVGHWEMRRILWDRLLELRMWTDWWFVKKNRLLKLLNVLSKSDSRIPFNLSLLSTAITHAREVVKQGHAHLGQ